jgi:hypothetical protein
MPTLAQVTIGDRGRPTSRERPLRLIASSMRNPRAGSAAEPITCRMREKTMVEGHQELVERAIDQRSCSRESPGPP